MTVADPTRSPAGTESLWAYTHVPQDIVADGAGEIAHTGQLTGSALERFVERVEGRLEAHAPGFRSAVVGCHVQGPSDIEAANASLVGGANAARAAVWHDRTRRARQRAGEVVTDLAQRARR
ncbi:MAG: hypothetical protein ACSLFP_07270 [Acidimicrobiales bacterium]